MSGSLFRPQFPMRAAVAKMIVQIPSAEPVPTSHKDQSRMRERSARQAAFPQN